MRFEKLPNPPAKVGGIIEGPPQVGALCDCGQPAARRFKNLYRRADVCVAQICREREYAWVGNYPRPVHKDFPKRESTKLTPTDRSMTVDGAVEERDVRQPGDRRFDLHKAADREALGQRQGKRREDRRLVVRTA